MVSEASALQGEGHEHGHSLGRVKWSVAASFIAITAMYIIATGAAVGVCYGSNEPHRLDPIFVAAVSSDIRSTLRSWPAKFFSPSPKIASAVGMFVIFIFSALLGNTSCFDPYWVSVGS